jgi:hypothetical protein
LRSLGYAPMVFSSLDEFAAALGSATARLDMLFLGDLPETDHQGRAAAACVMAAIDPKLPVFQLPLTRAVGGRSRRRANPGDRMVTAPPRFFGQLFDAIQSFLDMHGFESAPGELCWGGYAFDPSELTVSFGDQEVQLDAVAFDVALEFFYNAGEALSVTWLRRMLPVGERGANWHRIDNLACTVEDLRFALQLHHPNRWVLATLGDAGYRLLRAPRPSGPGSSSARELKRLRALAPLVLPSRIE